MSVISSAVAVRGAVRREAPPAVVARGNACRGSLRPGEYAVAQRLLPPIRLRIRTDDRRGMGARRIPWPRWRRSRIQHVRDARTALRRALVDDRRFLQHQHAEAPVEAVSDTARRAVGRSPGRCPPSADVALNAGARERRPSATEPHPGVLQRSAEPLDSLAPIGAACPSIRRTSVRILRLAAHPNHAGIEPGGSGVQRIRSRRSPRAKTPPERMSIRAFGVCLHPRDILRRQCTNGRRGRPASPRRSRAAHDGQRRRGPAPSGRNARRLPHPCRSGALRGEGEESQPRATGPGGASAQG